MLKRGIKIFLENSLHTPFNTGKNLVHVFLLCHSIIEASQGFVNPKSREHLLVFRAFLRESCAPSDNVKQTAQVRGDREESERALSILRHHQALAVIEHFQAALNDGWNHTGHFQREVLLLIC